ncbi:hypothetical protein HOY82DRAFT_380381 [Tuber indicum]|nr:hypothetical protein HOY82DRAFT_380381 [Tuber indicum]
MTPHLRTPAVKRPSYLPVLVRLPTRKPDTSPARTNTKTKTPPNVDTETPSPRAEPVTNADCQVLPWHLGGLLLEHGSSLARVRGIYSFGCLGPVCEYSGDCGCVDGADAVPSFDFVAQAKSHHSGYYTTSQARVLSTSVLLAAFSVGMLMAITYTAQTICFSLLTVESTELAPAQGVFGHWARALVTVLPALSSTCTQ